MNQSECFHGAWGYIYGVCCIILYAFCFARIAYRDYSFYYLNRWNFSENSGVKHGGNDWKMSDSAVNKWRLYFWHPLYFGGCVIPAIGFFASGCPG